MKKIITKGISTVLSLILICTMFGIGKMDVKAAEYDVGSYKDDYIAKYTADLQAAFNGRHVYSGDKIIFKYPSFEIYYDLVVDTTSEMNDDNYSYYHIIKTIDGNSDWIISNIEALRTDLIHIYLNSEIAPTNVDTSCSHDYEWVVQSEASATQDGIEEYRCSKCGHVAETRTTSAFGLFNEISCNQVTNAKAGDNVIIDNGVWNSYPKRFFENLAARRDISVTMRYIYKGVKYETLIPANAVIDTKEKWYGPLKIMELYGATIIK